MNRRFIELFEVSLLKHHLLISSYDTSQASPQPVRLCKVEGLHGQLS
jgi:hypothetical protein